MRLPALALATIIAVSASVSACGDPTQRTSERFCGELQAHLNEIQTPPTKADEIPALITLFSKMGEVAPLDVERDWEAVYASLKTANTVNPNDAASVQKVAATVLATQHSSDAVISWAKTNCNLDIGQVAVIDGPPVTTTTLVPPGDPTVTTVAPVTGAPAPTTTIVGP